MQNSFRVISFDVRRIVKLSHHLRNHESFDFSCVGNVRANAKIDHRPAAIYCSGGAIGDFGLDQILLIFVVLPGNEINNRNTKACRTHIEHLQEFLFWDNKTFKFLFLLDRKFTDLLQRGVVSVRHGSGQESTGETSEMGLTTDLSSIPIS